jgi:hypothetical protein
MTRKEKKKTGTVSCSIAIRGKNEHSSRTDSELKK